MHRTVLRLLQRRSLCLLSLALAVGAMTSCDKPQQGESASPVKPAGSGRIQIQTVNYPLRYFADRIGGQEVDVHLLVPKDEDPAFWLPTDEDIATLQKADIIVLNGATYSKWLDKVTLPESRTLDTSARFKKDFIEIKDAVTHSHGKEGEHSHSGTAFTTWLDFQQASLQADVIRAELQRQRTEDVELFALNYDLLKSELLALDKEMERLGKRIGSQPLVASHPVYQYWARRYGLNVQSVHWEPATVPDEEAMDELTKILATHPAKWMVWEGEPAAESVAKLKALGIESVIFDPCGNVPDEGSWLDVMKANLTRMKKVAGE